MSDTTDVKNVKYVDIYKKDKNDGEPDKSESIDIIPEKNYGYPNLF